MPMVRFQVRNEFGLGRPELYSVVDGEEDPKALLDGVSVAGFVGILRQLGDLAEFAAVVFHGLQENVMTTASRSQKLIIRARRLEAALPPLEKAVLSQTSHLHFAYTAGCEWRPLVHNKQNQFINSDLPAFVMDSYEECQDPPRFHLLDKFDTGGSGSCLKRYSDPTFFKRASGNPIEENDEKIQKHKKHKSRQKRKSLSKRNRAVSHIASMSNQTAGTHPISLNDDGHATSQTTSTSDIGFMSNMQEGFDVQKGFDKLERFDVQEQSEMREQFAMRELPHMKETSGISEHSDMQDQSIEYPNGSSYIEYQPNHSPVTKAKASPSAEFCSRSTQKANTKGSFSNDPFGNDDCIVHDQSTEYPNGSSYIEYQLIHSLVTKAKASPSAEFCSRSTQEADLIGSFSNDRFGNDDCIVPWASYEAWDEKAENMGTKEQEYLPDDGRDTLNNSFGPDTPDRGMSHVSSFNREEIQFNGVDITLKIPRRNELSGCDKALESQKEPETIGDQELIGESEIHSGPSEADDFVDALNTIESESENELENQMELYGAPMFEEVNHHVTKVPYGCTSKVDNTEDVSACGENSEISEDVQDEHETQRSDQLHTVNESHEISCTPDNEEDYFVLLDLAPKKIILDEVNLQISLHSQGFGSHENNNWHRSSSEENFATSPQLAEANPGEKILLEESSFFCPSLLEAIHAEKPLLEESVSTSPSYSASQNILLEEPLSICPSLVEAISGENIVEEETSAISASTVEAIPSEELHQGESTTLFPSMTDNFTDENILQNEISTASLSSVEAFAGEQLLQEDPSVIFPTRAEDIPTEIFHHEEPDITSSSLVKAAPGEKCLQDESFGTSSLLAEVVPSEKILQQESAVISPAMAEALPGAEILQEKSVASSPSLVETVSTSVVETIANEKIVSEESVAICPSLVEAFPDEKVLIEESVATYLPDHDHSINTSLVCEDKTVCCVERLPSLAENIPAEQTPQGSAYNSSNTDLHGNGDDHPDSSKGQSVASHPSMSAAGNGLPDSPILLNSRTVSSVHEPQKSVLKTSCVQPVTIWTNGNLLGLAPSKPPVFAVPNSSNQDFSNSEVELIENTSCSQNLPCSINDIILAAPCAIPEKPGGYSQQISYGVFNLSHRLLTSGFSRRIEATTEQNSKLYDTGAIDESLFGSPSSSPPLEHMKISFNPLNGSAGLKLNIPRDNSDTFASFQLVPGVSSLHDIAGESDDDTFCRSSPYISDDCLSDRSELDSEQWDSEESFEQKDRELYASVAEASLSASFLDLPCFDTVDMSVPLQKQGICESELLKKQWSISDPAETDSDEKTALSDSLVHPNRPLPGANKINDEEAAASIPESKVL